MAFEAAVRRENAIGGGVVGILVDSVGAYAFARGWETKVNDTDGKMRFGRASGLLGWLCDAQRVIRRACYSVLLHLRMTRISRAEVKRRARATANHSAYKRWTTQSGAAPM